MVIRPVLKCVHIENSITQRTITTGLTILMLLQKKTKYVYLHICMHFIFEKQRANSWPLENNYLPMSFSRAGFLIFLISSLISYLISLWMWFKLYPVLFFLPTSCFINVKTWLIYCDYKRKTSHLQRHGFFTFIDWKCVFMSFRAIVEYEL